jgi:alkylation response protein AidB-like acyl-CoA dehydrogenase
MALEVIDRAIQSFGAEGISQDTELAYHWAQLRTLRIADVCNNSAVEISAEVSALGTRCRTYSTSRTD